MLPGYPTLRTPGSGYSWARAPSFPAHDYGIYLTVALVLPNMCVLYACMLLDVLIRGHSNQSDLSESYGVLFGKYFVCQSIKKV